MSRFLEAVGTLTLLASQLLSVLLYFWTIYIGVKVYGLIGFLACAAVPIIPTIYFAFKTSGFENGDLLISPFTLAVLVDFLLIVSAAAISLFAGNVRKS